MSETKPVTRAQVLSILARLSYAKCERESPDPDRQRRFKAGWRDAKRRPKPYTERTLRRLTWQNLGYRFAQHLRGCGEEDIGTVYAILASVYGSPQEADITLPEEVEERADSLAEGALRRISVNAYERNARARQLCIDRYGVACMVCGFNFGQTYGLIGEGLIHVHHLKPLSEIRESYTVDPVRDLRPVCPNCHAMIHRNAVPLGIEELKAVLTQRRRSLAPDHRAKVGTIPELRA